MKSLIGFFLFAALSSGLCNVTAELMMPQNVTLSTLNTQYILRWSWDHRMAGNRTVTFTTQWIAKYKIEKNLKKDWRSSAQCENTPATWCDFTGAELHYLGVFLLRVRASSDGQHSQWVFSEFCPDKDATLGPPSRVEVTSADNLLEVTISEPLTSHNGSMKDLVPKLYFRVQYWQRGANPPRPLELDTSTGRVTLPALDARTWYCVRVQSCYDYYHKRSVYSPAQCVQTEGQTPYWQIFLYFLSSVVLGFLLVLLPFYVFFRFYGVIKATFYPSIQLPTSIQEYLYDSLSSDAPRLLTPDSQRELCCDQVNVCPQEVLLEVHSPPASGLEQDSSRHSRQGSGDSGVYSTEGGMALQQPEEQDGGGQTPVEEVKLVAVGSGPKAPGFGEVDEGILDVCV